MTVYFEVNPLYDSRVTARVSFTAPCDNIVHSSSADEMECQGFCSVGDFFVPVAFWTSMKKNVRQSSEIQPRSERAHV